MKRLLKNIAVLMMVMVLMISVCAMPAFAAGGQINAVNTKFETPATDFVYTVLSDGTAEISGYTGTATDIVIPSTIDGHKVTSVGNSAFLKDSLLTSVEIPSGVTKIGDYAFGYCESLGNTTIPSSVTSIVKNAFFNNSDDLTIYCFKNTAASSFAKENGIRRAEFSYTVLEDGTAEISTYYENATDVEIPSTVDGYVVTSIGDQSFIFSDVESVVIPDTVTKIDDLAFCQCNSLTSVKMPKTLTYLGEYAFAYTDISTITLPDGIKWIDNSTFSNCTSLESITIPDTVELIFNYAFFNCESLKSVTLSENLDCIDSYAFKGCASMESIIIPHGVRHILNGAFDGCAESFAVYGYAGTEAEAFANRNGFDFVPFNVSV
ncbi:MAG: leucine-rich repeat protein [Ruminococcus sp.]|nr:leucine-rich repeat protein [Ruminococcus sp.]